MKKTVIVYGTSTGTCEELANKIGGKLGVDNIINVTDLDSSVIADNDNLILGTSTWGAGEMQTSAERPWLCSVAATRSLTPTRS